jgi:TolB-like protein
MAVPLLSAVILTGWPPAALAVTLDAPATSPAAPARPPATPRQRVAVVAFRTMEDVSRPLGEATAETLRSALIQLQRVTVIERGQIEQVIREQHFTGTGLVEGESAVALGRLIGANAIIVGSVTRFGDTYTINARSLDAVTGEALTAGQVSTRYEEDIPSLMPDLARTLFPAATVTAAADPAPTPPSAAGPETRTVTLEPASQPVAVMAPAAASLPEFIDTRTPAEIERLIAENTEEHGWKTVPSGQYKAAALGLGLVFPGAGQAYAGNWGGAGSTLLWVAGGLITMFLSTGFNNSAGFAIGMSGLGVALLSHVTGALEGMHAVQESTVIYE